MLNKLQPLLITLVFAAIALPSVAFASGPSWGSSSDAPSARDLIPDPRGSEAYSERYTFFAQLEGGGSAYLDLTISNLGWGDKHGLTTGEIKIPGKKTYRFKKKLDEDEWSYRRDRFEIEIGPTKISGNDDDGFRLVHNGARKVDLTFKSRTPMWRPGAGRFVHDGDVYATTLAVPWGDVTGTVGAESVRGVGMFDHGMSTFAPFDLADKFTRMRHYEDGLFIAWREVDLTEDAGQGSVTWIVVGVDDRIVFSDSAATISWSKASLHEESGHRVPSRVVISGTDGNKRLRLSFDGRSRRATDLLAEYGTAARAVAGAVSNPWQFQFRGTYDLAIVGPGSDVRRTGRSKIELDIIGD